MTEIIDFASSQHCELVIAAFERCRASHSHKVGDSFFDHRVLWINSFPDSENEARRILQSWRNRSTQVISDFTGQTLYSDTVQVVRWDGPAMPPHQDDRHPDGSTHKTPWREWAALIYLNDSFDGGELYFPETHRIYKPRKGSLIFFKGSAWHGVRAVSNGIRYTSPGWFTQDSAREDRYARIEY